LMTVGHYAAALRYLVCFERDGAGKDGSFLGGSAGFPAWRTVRLQWA
jgi:hypothetical protein